jgi:hypothetical protein
VSEDFGVCLEIGKSSSGSINTVHYICCTKSTIFFILKIFIIVYFCSQAEFNKLFLTQKNNVLLYSSKKTNANWIFLLQNYVVGFSILKKYLELINILCHIQKMKNNCQYFF